jgi:simple sugar transport system permease protein
VSAVDLTVAVLAAAVALGAPLLYAALGELVSETAGVINIQLEGMMLCGALAGVWAGATSGSVVIGFAGGALAGMVLAGLHGALCFVLGANQVVSGVVLNILALGGTSFLASSVLVESLAQGSPTLEPLEIPLLSDVPVVGRILFQQDVMVYAVLVAVPVLAVLRRRSKAGLMLSAVGEHPSAAASLGVSVAAVRWAALLFCGGLAGLGGAQLVLASLGAFTEDVTAGRGFIALAAVVFGRWRPVGTLVAVLLFAAAEALQVRAQILGIDLPYQALVALPYLVTIVALAGFLRSMRAPAALGTPYARS